METDSRFSLCSPVAHSLNALYSLRALKPQAANAAMVMHTSRRISHAESNWNFSSAFEKDILHPLLVPSYFSSSVTLTYTYSE